MNESTLEMIPRPVGSSDVAPERAQMLSDMELYTSGFPCPTCMTAIYWSRISVVYYACSEADTLESGIQGIIVESEQAPLLNNPYGCTAGVQANDQCGTGK